MCDEPMIPDPYEQLHVYVMKSHVGGAGEGLFSRENVDENTPMAFYNGIRMTSDQIVTQSSNLKKPNYFRRCFFRRMTSMTGKLTPTKSWT